MVAYGDLKNEKYTSTSYIKWVDYLESHQVILMLQQYIIYIEHAYIFFFVTQCMGNLGWNYFELID